MKTLFPLMLAVLGLSAGLGGGYALRPGSEADAAMSVEAHDAPEPGGDAGADGGQDAGSAPAEDHPAASEVPSGDQAASAGHDGEGSGHGGSADDGRPAYVKLSNQFIVPVVEEGRVASMVILSLTLEVAQGSTEAVFAIEPKVRDALLQVLFDHANAGGFRGSFTDGANLIVLRRALLEAARKAAGDRVRDVLIADIARQDS